MAGNRRSGGGSRSTRSKLRYRAATPSSSENSDSDDEVSAAGTTYNKQSCTGRPTQMMQEVSTRAMADLAGGVDGVSSIQGSMTGGPINLETWWRMEKKL